MAIQVDVVGQIKEYAKSKAKTKLVNDIDESILQLAKFCGRKDLKKTKMILDKKIDLEDYFSELDEELEEVFQLLFANVKSAEAVKE